MQIYSRIKIVFFCGWRHAPETPKEQEKLRAEALDNFLTDAAILLKGRLE